VLNFNFTDDAKTVTREEVLGSSAVENAPPQNAPDQWSGAFLRGWYGLEQGGGTKCRKQSAQWAVA